MFDAAYALVGRCGGVGNRPEDLPLLQGNRVKSDYTTDRWYLWPAIDCLHQMFTDRNGGAC